MSIIAVGMGGVFGALVRYYLSITLNTQYIFPWGTFLVNIVGSFFLAYFLTIALSQVPNTSFSVQAVATGFTGSLTTFSAFSVESVEIAYISSGLMAAYLVSSLLGGLFMAYIGRRLGKEVSSLSGKDVESERG